MNIFKTFTLKWWQGSLLKISMILAGIAIGSTWPSLFNRWVVVLWSLSIILAVYITYVWWSQ